MMDGSEPGICDIHESPCPRCGYDLRGHLDPTRCPECGCNVHVGAAIGDMCRWVDLRLLDLWSIAVLMVVGGAAMALALLAIRQGHYVALMLGLLAGLCMSVAAMWFLAICAALAVRVRCPTIRTVGRGSRRSLWRWMLADGLLIAGALGMFALLSKL